jgi:hypothetical protein
MQPCIQLEKMYEVTLGTLQALNKALSKRNAECLKAIQTMDEISKKNEKEALYWKDKYIRWQNRVEGLLNVCVVFSVTYAVYEWWRNL